MRILYLITVKGHGSGGHVHSLNHISTALGEQKDIGICSFGPGRSVVLENNSHFKKHIHFTGINILTLRQELKTLIKAFRPDIIHCFDVPAYNLFTFLFNVKRYRVFLNLCGGPNPTEFPLIENLILFSEENRKWFHKRSKFDNTNIAVIPNRVNPKELQFKFGRPIAKENSFCFVRITRIGRTYEKSIKDSIRLIKCLTDKGLDVFFYIIGAIEDIEIAHEIEKEIIGLPIRMINDETYTQKASDMLYLADAVIATGRGIMEATSLNKPILTPAQNSDLPLLIDNTNFDGFLSTNFSQRNIGAESSLQTNLSRICKLIEDKRYYDDMSELSLSLFRKYFSTGTGSAKYLQFYRENCRSNAISLSFTSNIYFKLKTWLIFIKHSK